MTRYNYAKLRGRIIEKYGKMSKFAEDLGISKNSLSAKLACRIGLSQDEILKWANLLDIPERDIALFFFSTEFTNC